MQLDGSIISANFDNSLEMGVVGTSSGTLWYINWEERSSIRLVSGHVNQVREIYSYLLFYYASREISCFDVTFQIST